MKLFVLEMFSLSFLDIVMLENIFRISTFVSVTKKEVAAAD